MPLIFGELAVRYSPRRVSDPALPDAAANGQYLLVRAAAHRRSAASPRSPPSCSKTSPWPAATSSKAYKIRFRLGRGLVRTRMYNSWEELRIGWTKNLALLFPDARQLARKRSGSFAACSCCWRCPYCVPRCFRRGLTTRIGTAGHWIPVPAVIFLWLFTLSNFAVFYARVARAHSAILAVAALHLRPAVVCRAAAPVGQGPRGGKRHLAGTRLLHRWSRSARLTASNSK